MRSFGNKKPKKPYRPASKIKPVVVWALLAASEATKASKQPQRSSLTVDFKSVTPMTHLSMCILHTWYGPFWQPLRSLHYKP